MVQLLYTACLSSLVPILFGLKWEKLTLQGSWMGKISSPNSYRSILESCHINCFQLQQVLRGKSETFEWKEAGAMARFNCHKNRKLPPACKQWWPKCGCCNSGCFIRTGLNFLIKWRAKNGTRGFSLLLTGFSRSPIKHHSTTQFTKENLVLLLTC